MTLRLKNKSNGKEIKPGHAVETVEGETATLVSFRELPGVSPGRVKLRWGDKEAEFDPSVIGAQIVWE